MKGIGYLRLLYHTKKHPECIHANKSIQDSEIVLFDSGTNSITENSSYTLSKRLGLLAQAWAGFHIDPELEPNPYRARAQGPT